MAHLKTNKRVFNNSKLRNNEIINLLFRKSTMTSTTLKHMKLYRSTRPPKMLILHKGQYPIWKHPHPQPTKRRRLKVQTRIWTTHWNKFWRIRCNFWKSLSVAVIMIIIKKKKNESRKIRSPELKNLTPPRSRGKPRGHHCLAEHWWRWKDQMKLR